MKKSNGFTLAELLATIVIISVVLTIAIVAVLPRITESRIGAFVNDTVTFTEAARNKYKDDRLERDYPEDLYHNTVSGKKCYSVKDTLIGKYIKTNNSYTGSIEVCHGQDCDYETKVWLTNGRYYLEGEIIDDNTDIKPLIKESYSGSNQNTCGRSVS
ncbi:MAG: prepilin-type N-terminal cleavage/methylation domain-containing protein [Bacilli bacterium]|nr:prepilin-type N-terminal cleavage/methylation domain-containing protein [Bacilli bacterium]